MTTHIGVRLTVYGYYSAGTIYFPIEEPNYSDYGIESLGDLMVKVDDYVFGSGIIDQETNETLRYYCQLRPLLRAYRGITLWPLHELLINGLMISLYIGFFFAYMCIWFFSEEENTKNLERPIFFLVPIFIGIISIWFNIDIGAWLVLVGYGIGLTLLSRNKIKALIQDC
ncbi:hypothetical protein ACFLRN_05200 [Thermoproteota archaeon]